MGQMYSIPLKCVGGVVMLLSGALWREVFSNKSLRCLLYSVDKGIKSGQKEGGRKQMHSILVSLVKGHHFLG